MKAIIQELTDCLGPKNVLLESDIGEKYKKDWSGTPAVCPQLVCRPKTTHELSKTLVLNSLVFCQHITDILALVRDVFFSIFEG